MNEYLDYKGHVSRQVYTSDREIVDMKLDTFESQWPEYKSATNLISSPAYLRETPYDLTCAQTDEAMTEIHTEGQAWLKKHLCEDVEQLQMMKQHHVHLRNPETNKREPLAACRSKENPNLCKSNFPRNRWLVVEAIVLCGEMLKQMGLYLRGRRCQLGSMHGPMLHENLNATHSAMLAAQRCNSDVQIPYRFPIIEETHSCDDPKCLQYSEKVMIEATQIAQDVQAGYACDYCTKRQPMAFNECKECCKGHRQLAQNLRNEPLNRIGKRHATRLMSDAYGKGIVRAQVENTN